MQEKIGQPSPSEIKIIEGKPPPTSWVSENIVQYCQIQSEIELLTDVMSYVHELQSQQLTQMRGKSLLLKESFVSIPEKGSSADIGNKASYNAMQGYIKTQITYLGNLVQTLKQGNPQLSKTLDPFIDQLQQIGQSFPHLSKQQLQDLATIMEKLVQNAKSVPFPVQRTFWNQQLNMMQSLMAENGSNIKDFQNEIKELKARSQMLIEVEELLQNLQDTLKKQPPTQEDVTQMIENLQNLANKNPLMNPSQSQALVSFFQQLNNFKNTKGVTLSDSVADALIQTKISAFLKTHPNATPQQIKEHLSDFLKQSNLQTSSLPFMKSMGDSIEDVLDKKDFPATSGNTGAEFATAQQGQIQENTAFFPALLGNYAPDSKSVNSLAGSAQKISSTISDEINGNAAKIEGYQSAIAKLSATQNNFGKAALWTVGQSLQIGHPAKGTTPVTTATPAAAAAPPGAAGASQPNLPYNFEQAILNHYMPGQEAYLEALAEMLLLDNAGAMFGNTLLQDMLGFAGASNTFSFSNGLHPSGNGNFSGSYSKAKQQISNERHACSKAISQVEKTLNDIQNELDSINKQLQNKNLTPAQRQTLENQKASLTTLQQNLFKLYNPYDNPPSGTLVTLHTELYQISVQPPNPPATKGTAFSISGPPGWESQLGKDESVVINGDASGQGGLVNVQAQAQTFQQTYADQSQNQQLILQMRMTEIQQEWTVVSTSLQLLFQNYTTLAQAIYGG